MCHGGSENSHKLYYYKDSFHFHCYTNCGGGKDIYQLVIDAKATQGFELTFPDAVKWVAELTGKSFTVSRDIGKSNDRVDDWKWIEKVTKKSPKATPKLKVFDENVLEVYLPHPHHSWIEDGIGIEAMKKNEISYYLKNDSIIIPHRSENGELIGIRQRNLRKEDVEQGRKYIPVVTNGVMYNHLTAHNLYNFHNSKKVIHRIKKAIIYEGEKSCLLNQTYYSDCDFSVAVSGSNISTIQRELLLKTNVEEVFIAFDKFRGQKENESNEVYERWVGDYQKKLVRLAHLFTPFVRTYILWDYNGLLDDNDSPSDKGQEVLEKMMLNKIEIQTKDVIF